MTLIDDLLTILPNRYSPADRDLILRAYNTALEAHEGQSRASGEPYVNHCLAVASILSEMKLPPDVVAAGLLHDTVEDTALTLQDIETEYGEEISKLVDGVTKLTQLPRVSRVGKKDAGSEDDQPKQTDEEQKGSHKRTILGKSPDLSSETLRKTFLAMSEDIRVVLIKLADRLHNMRTLGYIPEAKQKRIANQTLDIFAPLANRLGIWQFKWELEDLSFRYVDPDQYKEIAQSLADRRSKREKQMKSIVHDLRKLLSDSDLEGTITGRPKHIYSIFRKMQEKNVPFDLVHDVRAIRIIVSDISHCYSILGLIHTKWRPIPGEFDDYIAAPKDNFYQSLHTAVVYDDGKTLEVQIRTNEMHQNAEYGIAAHWRYKEGAARDSDYEARIIWIRKLMEWMQDVEDASEFVDGMKSDVFGDRVYAFTPRGDIIDLPAGATPIDFAYHVHTAVGHRCRGAKVNGKLVSLDYVLNTGDQVEILTTKRGGPSRDWLNTNLGLINTHRARAKVRRWFKRQNQEENISDGKSQYEREFKRLGLGQIDTDELLDYFDFSNLEDFYEAIGCGDLSIGKVINYLTLEEEETELFGIKPVDIDQTVTMADDSVRVLGLKGLLATLGKCCKPAPGDAITGYITRGRGATIHRQDCPNILRVRDRERLVQVSWGEQTNTYPVAVRIRAFDRDGLLRDVSTVISEENLSMGSINVSVSNNQANFDLILNVSNIRKLSRVLTRLENLPNVLEARRINPG